MRVFTNIRTYYYIFIFILILLTITWYILTNQSMSVVQLEPKINSFEPLVYKCCVPLTVALRKNIFFFKTHKTGGSTIQNILMRFSLRYALNIMDPIYYSYHQPFSNLSLWPGTMTPDNKYNILAHHMRYTSLLKSYQYPDTATVTILRHPTTLFESLYEFFAMQNTVGMTFEQFVKAPVKPAFVWSIDSLLVYRGYNQMSLDLGFDVWNAGNQTAIEKIIDKIDKEFDFVMITEYMEASLVLLANLMGWPLEYMVHLNNNVRPIKPNRYVLTEQDRITLMELNPVDTFLYRHFLKKLRKCVRQYGEDRLNERISVLRRMNSAFKARCVKAENNFGQLGTVNYIPRNISDWECAYATKMEIQFEDELRRTQFLRLRKQST